MAGSRVRFRNLVAVVQLCYCRHPVAQRSDLGYWPAAGLLESSGQSYLGLFGYYWAATPGENLSPGISQEECAYGYNFDNQHSQTSYLQYRHTVLSVRCVKVQ